MKKLLLVIAFLVGPGADAGVRCSGTPCLDSSGGVTSPIAVDPLSVTGVVTFDNAANTAATFTDGACAVGVTGTANSVCLSANGIDAEGVSADAFEFRLAFGDSTASQTLTCTGAASSLGCVVASPAVPVNGTTAGNALALTASPAIPNAGAGTDGAAAGGSVTITAGAAARDTSGNANGGDINLTPGAGIGTGTTGRVVATNGVSAGLANTSAGTTAPLLFGAGGSAFSNGTAVVGVGVATNSANPHFYLLNGPTSTPIDFNLSATAAQMVLVDAGLARVSAGVLKTTDASSGNGNLSIGTGILTASTMTAETTAYVRTVTSSYTWTNAQVVALGAALTGDINVATLPAKTQVLDALVVITGQGAGTASLTVSCGDAIGGTPFINYVVASSAQAAVNTVYGDAVAERGTSIDTEFFYLPSYTATTLVTCHFVSTVQNLDQVTGSTGRVILTHRLLP